MPRSLPIAGQQRAEAGGSPSNREADIRMALLLTYITLGWMAIEGAASIILGILAKSLLLEAFGIDSAVELFSACVLSWRLRVETSGTIDEARIQAVECRASRLAGYALYVLALYVIVSSVYGLVTDNATDTRQSIWGIIVGVVAAFGMPVLAKYKLRLAAPNRLNSKALAQTRWNRLRAAICPGC